jgi:hypothetical protein
MYTYIQIEGAEELEKKLLNLEAKAAKIAIRSSFKGAAKIFIAAVRVNVMAMVGGVMGGYLWKMWEIRVIPTSVSKRFSSVGVRIQLSPKANEVFVHKAKGKSRYKGGRTYIPSAIEYGHIAANGRFVPARPFARKAFDATEGQMAEAMEKEMLEAVEEAFYKTMD